MKISSLVLAISALVVSNISFAKTATVEEQFVQKLSQCDVGLYEFIYEHRDTLSQYAPIKTQGELAFFDLSAKEDTLYIDESFVKFSKPMKANGIEFTGFEHTFHVMDFNLIQKNAKENDRYIFTDWFLVSSDSPNKIVKNFPTLNLTPRKKNTWASSPEWIIPNIQESTEWVTVKNLKWGTRPSSNTIEKSFFLDKANHQSYLGCTIQGVGTMSKELMIPIGTSNPYIILKLYNQI